MDGYDIESVRKEIIGRDLVFETPFGPRQIFYADYTASGRTLMSVEKKLLNIQTAYANTHTEDDFSGKTLTRLLHEAEKRIKDMVNAGPGGKIIATGSGSTGALKKLQEIIGVYVPPATRDRMLLSCSRVEGGGRKIWQEMERNQPVVFIGPYEHHTNELMWREAWAEVVVVGLDRQGRLDLDDLESKVSDPLFGGRVKMASLSAGSNITGLMTDVYAAARICHRHRTLIFFDFAAVAPYVRIDMNLDDECYFDAIFFSPHKFLGGPGSSGILVINENIYRKDLAPTTAGGGTVVYVGFHEHDFSRDIEAREKAGTPPILQTIKAALAMDVKRKIGVEAIEAAEKSLLRDFIGRLKDISGLETIDDYARGPRLPIISFNIRHKDRHLHPKFVTKLLNDAFGIQSRAGCSCAGPYGHILLGLDDQTSRKIRGVVAEGQQGFKPGWVRINIHYTFTDDDLEFLVRSLRFVSEFGPRFLHRYAFDMSTGEWTYIDFDDRSPAADFDGGLEADRIAPQRTAELRESYFLQAEEAARALEAMGEPEFIEDCRKLEEIKGFYYAHRV